MAKIVNIAAYKFLSMGEPASKLAPLRTEIKAQLQRLGLKGTVLLAPEGINLFLAGERESVDGFLTYLRQLPGLGDLTVKESLSDRVPFQKLMVKLKKEIISFRQPEVDPVRDGAPRISPEELKQWLDEGKPVVLLDTRNSYEVDAGTFQGAVTLPLRDFTHFPEAVKRAMAPDESRPVVTFCTGGIRCEKAAPFLARQGVRQVYQLEGGILNYFEKVGGAHYAGNCFVFDDRGAVTPTLQPAGAGADQIG